ncbi:unnamed protein product [Laminaria digitata]
MPSSDIATSVVDSIDAAVVSPAAGGAPPPSESARQDDKGDKEGARILFRDEEEFRRKRERMVADGAHQLQVIADFDFTMTKFWVNGRRGHSCHQVIGESGLLSEEFHERIAELRNHYYPLEVDPDLTHETRVEKMVEWVTKVHEVMVQAGISKDIVSAAVAKSELQFRHGHGELFGWLENEGVPLLLFSAGIADVLEEALLQRSEKPVPSNCHIISNRMAFDEEGTMTGFEGECLHVFNKHASSAVVAPYFQREEMQRRGNVVLLGDSLGDLNMAKGAGSGEVLTVGFLNDKVEERLDTYTSAYDVVILGDGNFDFVLQLLEDVAPKRD